MDELTTEQLLAINSRKQQVIVTASAGAGKTSTMVNRVIDLVVKEGGLSASDIIMLTFTEAAAAEMKSKLEVALLERLANAKGGEKAALIRLLDTLPLLSCSTIDSYCFSFVKTHFEMLDLPPTISIVGEETAKSYREKAIKTVLEEYAKECLDGAFADPDEYYRFMGSFGTNEDTLAGAIQNIYDYAETTEDGDAFMNRAERYASAPIDELPPIKEFFTTTVNKAREARERILALGFVPPVGAEKMQSFFTAMDASFAAIEGATSLEDVFKAAENLPQPPALGEERKRFKNECTLYDIAVKAYKDWRQDLWGTTDDKRTSYLRRSYADVVAEIDAARADTVKMVELARRFKEQYHAIKEKEEVLDFCDVEHLALKLLKDDPAVVAEVGCRELLMDESQDLNRLQEALMIALAGEGDLYVVGDVKQSIYRFRLAEPELFDERVKRGEKLDSAEVIHFNQNFRSSDAVVDFVNRVFLELMTEDFGGTRFTPASRGKKHEGEGAVKCFFYPKKKGVSGEIEGEVYSVRRAATEVEKSEMESGEEKEARWVRDNILELIRNKKTLRSTKDDAEFDIRYEDIAILSPARMKSGSVEEKVVNCLREAGIPINIGGFVKDASNVDISALMDFLRLLISPRDDYAMLSVMRSELFSFTADRLAEISLAEGDCFSEKAEKMKESAPDLSDFFDCIREYRSLSSALSLYELLSRLVEERLRKKILLCPDGRKSFGEILSFLETLKSGRETESIPEYLDFFDKYYKMDFEGEIAERNAVRFFTIHKSKGLEFPIVFVIGLDEQIVNGMENRVVVRMDNEFGVAKKAENGKDLLFELFRLKKKKELTQDKVRMLYVALTRAKNYLYLSGGYPTGSAEGDFSKEKAKTCSELILAGMGEYPYVDDYTEEPRSVLDASDAKDVDLCDEKGADSAPYDGETVALSELSAEEDIAFSEIAAAEAEEKEAEVMEYNRQLALFRDALTYRYPHESATKTGIKFTVTGINEMAKDSMLPPTRFFPEEAKAKGTAYHAVMEYVSFDMASVEEAKATLGDLVERGVITADEAADISPKRLYEGVKIIAEKVVQGASVLREKSFILHVPANEAGVADAPDEVEVQGKLDLLVIKGDGSAAIVDYKLSAQSEGELIDAYQKQLSLYATAVKSGFGLDPVRKYIFVLGRNELIEIEK